MESYKKHYHDVVQKDLILTENLSTVSMLAGPNKLSLCLGGDSTDEKYVISSLAALKIISGQTPYFTRQQPTPHRPTQQKSIGTREGVGGKVTLRKSSMYFFLHKLLFNVLPYIKQFEGLGAPAHNKIYCFTLKDIFCFQELVPLFPYFEDLGSIQFQLHFTTRSKEEVVNLGNGLQLCFLSVDK